MPKIQSLLSPFLLFICMFCLVFSEVVKLLDDTDLKRWTPEAVTGRTRNGFIFNDSIPRVCDVGNDYKNFLVSPIVDLGKSRALWLSMTYLITPCDQLSLQYGPKCTETLNLYLLPLETNNNFNSPVAEFNYNKLDASNKIATLSTRGDIFVPFTTQLDLDRQFPQKIQFARFVIEDFGTCSQIKSFTASFRQCPQVVKAQSNFTRTSAPFVPKESVTGTCVAGAEGKYPPTYSCKSDGEWDQSEPILDFCQCKIGYQQNGDNCEPCPLRQYKEERGNRRCKPCPEHSRSTEWGSAFCRCDPHFYRAPGEPNYLPCGGPPSQPRNLSYVVRGTHVTITWQRPENDGGRSEIFYSIQCATCKQTDPKYLPVYSVPDSSEIRALSVNVTNLEPHTDYMFQVTTKNAISSVPGIQTSYEMVKFKTAENPKIEITHATVLDGDSVLLRWQPPMLGMQYPTSPNNPLEYRILRVFRGQPTYVRTTQQSFMFKSLEKGMHEFRVSFKDGTHASAVIQRESQGHYSQTEEEFKRMAFTVGVVLTVILILVVACLTAVCCYRKSAYDHYKNASSSLYYPGYAHYSNSYHPDMIAPNAYSKLPVGGPAFVDPTQAEPSCAEQLISECGVHEVDEERLTIPTKSDYSACELKGTFGFIKGSFLEGSGSYSTANPAVSSIVETPVLIKRSSYAYLGALNAERDIHGSPMPSLHLMGQSAEKRTFMNEIAIAAQLSYDCNVLKLFGIVRKDYPEIAIYEHAETTLEWALRNNTLMKQRRSLASSKDLSHGDDNYCSNNAYKTPRSTQEVHIMRGVATGMQYLSELGYIHKVLRSRNVYLTEEGTPKIAGFDHRVLMDEELMDSSIETKELWIEMLPWFSPEVLECGKFSPASDVWAFGVLMWEMISQGDRPWADKYPEEIQKAIFCGHRLSVNNTPCSMALYNLMLQCWEGDEKRRPNFAFLSQTFYHFVKQRDALAQQVGSTLPRNNRLVTEPDSSTYATLNLSPTNGYPSLGVSPFGSPQTQPRAWTMQECLIQLKLSQYHQNFKSNGIQFLDELLEANVDQKTLRKIGINNEKHRKQLMKYISLVKHHNDLKTVSQTSTSQNFSLKPNPAVSVL